MAQETLGTFGYVEDDAELEALDAELEAEPIPFNIVGYAKRKGPDGTRETREFAFRLMPQIEFGPLFTALQQTDSKGNMTVSAGVQFIGDALIEEDRERWHQTLRDPAWHFRAEMLAGLAESLGERYSLRPSAPRSARRSGPRRSGTTSTAERGGRASTSKPRTRQTA